MNPTKWRPVEYRSKKIDKHQQNWDIHVKEFWAVQFACRKFRYFLEGHLFTLCCKQHSIAQIFNRYTNQSKELRTLDPRLQCWMLLILHFKI